MLPILFITFPHSFSSILCLGFSGDSVVKNQPDEAGDVGDVGLVPGLRRSPGGGNGNPLQNNCLGNPMDRRGWRVQSIGVTKSQTQWSNWAHTHTFSTPLFLLLLISFLFLSLLAITQKLKMWVLFLLGASYLFRHIDTSCIHTDVFTHVSLCKHSVPLVSLNSSKSSFSRHSLSLFPDDPWLP